MPIPSNNGQVIYSSGPVAPSSNSASSLVKVPSMKISMDSTFNSMDPRVSDVPEFHPGTDAMDWDENTPLAPKQTIYKQHESLWNDVYNNHSKSGASHADAVEAANKKIKEVQPRSAHDGDEMSSMSEDADDANPITPFHDVIRNHGGYYAGHTREGKKGEIRKNIYKVPNPKGGAEKVELHAHQSGPDYGEVNSITHSGDPEATAPRVNNSPEKLDRNIHAQSYRGAPDRPKKMKPAEVRANRKFLDEL